MKRILVVVVIALIIGYVMALGMKQHSEYCGYNGCENVVMPDTYCSEHQDDVKRDTAILIQLLVRGEHLK